MNFQPHIKRTFIHAIAIAAALCFSAYANAQDVVTCKGRVLRDTASTTPISVVIINGPDTVNVALADNGSFSFVAPASKELWVGFGTNGRTMGEVKLAGLDTGSDHLRVLDHTTFFMELQQSTSEDAPSTIMVSGSISRVAQVDAVASLPQHPSSDPAPVVASR